MGKIIGGILGWTCIGLSLEAGKWVWKEILEDKATKAKDHFIKDNSKEDEGLV